MTVMVVVAGLKWSSTCGFYGTALLQYCQSAIWPAVCESGGGWRCQRTVTCARAHTWRISYHPFDRGVQSRLNTHTRGTHGLHLMELLLVLLLLLPLLNGTARAALAFNLHQQNGRRQTGEHTMLATCDCTQH